MKTQPNRPTLWSKDFVLAFISNLLLFFSFYMLVPVLPFYVFDNLKASGSLGGIVLSLYTISALMMRPFSGFMVDTFARKPLYLICYAALCSLFAGYVAATTLTLFIILRVVHGLAFGIGSVSGSTVAVDIMPSERRGEGIGYFGMAANIAMALGPVAGIWLHHHYSFNVVFLAAFASSLIGFCTIFPIKPIVKILPQPKQTMSLDRFILLRGLPCVVLLFFIGLSYGTVVSYIGLYSATLDAHAGIFFIFMAAGLILTRIFSAKSINNGKISQMICIGASLLIVSYLILSLCNGAWLLYLSSFLMGAGMGYTNPAFQTMLINLAEHNQRGTANATYYSFWDFGIGLGTAVGGIIIERFNFEWLYHFSNIALVIGLVYYIAVTAAYFKRNRLR